MNKETPTLRVGTGWIDLAVIGEPNVIQTFKGYAPVLPVKVIATHLDYFLYISAKSIAEKLEPLRQANAGAFNGLRLSIRKTSDDQFAPYEVKAI
jgi:hypothetical protein